MRPEDIERISLLIKYIVFFAVFFGWKPIGRYLLKKHPNNFFVYLFYMKYVKFEWKIIFLVAGALVFILLLIEDLDPASAGLISIVVSILTVGFIVGNIKKNIWKGDEKPTLEKKI